MFPMIETFSLFLALTHAIFLPGWLVVRIFFARQFTLLEEGLYAFALGFTLIDAIALILNRLHIPLSFTVLSLVLTATVFCLSGIRFWQKRHDTVISPPAKSEETAGTLPSKTWALLLGMLLITIILKAYYLIPAGLPTATDMGHHMYWSQFIAHNYSLPVYEKSGVVLDQTTGLTTITPPMPIADFIIGEHIPFGVMSILSGLSVIGSFPLILLFFINIASILAVLALTLRLGQNVFTQEERSSFIIGTFLVLGPLFTLASPQAKFVSGGVVGNLFGNFFIPLILLTFYLGFTKRKSAFLALGILLMGTLMYTHHLSTLVLGFLLIGIAFIASIALWDQCIDTFKEWSKLFFRPAVLSTAIGIILFLFLIVVPSYLDRSAIDSAIGSPVKTTRTGLSFMQVSNSVGIIKAAFAVAGFVLLLAAWPRFHRKDPLAWALILGWGGMLALMTLSPELLLLDIPSNRVGSYLVYPTALLVGYALAQLVPLLTQLRSHWLRSVLIPLLFILLIGNGLFENGASLLDQGKQAEVQELFAASHFLSTVTTDQDIILKDHNYLDADAWMKLFFLRGYSYPLSRGLFSRYDETGSRKERCTLVMIASPNGEEAKSCFDSTGTNYVVVNPAFDAVQFDKSPDFTRVYSSNHVAIFKRIK